MPPGVRSDHATAKHDKLCRAHAGDDTSQDGAAAGGLAEHHRCSVDRKPAGDITHGRQERQAALRVRHRFLGDRGRAQGEKTVGPFGIRSEVQVVNRIWSVCRR